MAKPATSYQAQLLDPHSAQAQPVSPRNGRSFKRAELYELLDCQRVEVTYLTAGLILISDEESLSHTPRYLNVLATHLYHQHVPEARGEAAIVGRAILCHDKQFR